MIQISMATTNARPRMFWQQYSYSNRNYDILLSICSVASSLTSSFFLRLCWLALHEDVMTSKELPANTVPSPHKGSVVQGLSFLLDFNVNKCLHKRSSCQWVNLQLCSGNIIVCHILQVVAYDMKCFLAAGFVRHGIQWIHDAMECSYTCIWQGLVQLRAETLSFSYMQNRLVLLNTKELPKMSLAVDVPT